MLYSRQMLTPDGRSAPDYERLLQPLTPLSPRWFYYNSARLLLNTVGRLSHGIQLAWQTGFDSGATLDYVYENRPQGITPLGRWLDRFYLDSPGWRGIRQRRANLERTLRETLQHLRAEGKPARLLDIASGPGRYVLETLRDLNDPRIYARLQDWDPRNVEAAGRRAQELGVANVTCVRGDAFDPAALDSLEPRPTLAIVSGLFELFPDNEMVTRSLRGLAAALRDGGYLIYTNQPWHPQLEFIARVLINREGKPWIMRCRSQSEMDELVRAVGFEKLSMATDDHGIFTVSVARRSIVP